MGVLGSGGACCAAPGYAEVSRVAGRGSGRQAICPGEWRFRISHRPPPGTVYARKVSATGFFPGALRRAASPLPESLTGPERPPPGSARQTRSPPRFLFIERSRTIWSAAPICAVFHVPVRRFSCSKRAVGLSIILDTIGRKNFFGRKPLQGPHGAVVGATLVGS